MACVQSVLTYGTRHMGNDSWESADSGKNKNNIKLFLLFKNFFKNFSSTFLKNLLKTF